MRLVFLIVYFIGYQLSVAQEMRVGTLHTLKVKQLQVESNSGTYSVYGDSTFLGELKSATFQLINGKVKVNLNGTSQTYEKVYVLQDSSNSTLAVKAIAPVSKQHYYQDNLEVSGNGARLRIVNLVDMNNYLAGVIESEGGGGRHLEYYKVQALMSRTYALKNARRHEKDGFGVCDGVHCQAYHNMLRHTPLIRSAVEETTGMVLTDEYNRLVTSYFSANCGGQICDASFIWNTSVPYVVSFVDTFCIHTRQATWKATVDKLKWKKFLEDEYGVTEEIYGDLLYNFEQNTRKAFFIHPSVGVPLRDLRTKFKLKSTYFSTYLDGDQVVILGRGFGHGVGLCQEGAMNMAAAGYDYTQIARFYFHNVKILDAERDKFFTQEDGLD